MPFANIDDKLNYNREYQSKERVWRPFIFKTDLPDAYIKALRIQASIDETTISGVISGYIKSGLQKDGRIKTGSA